MFFEKILFSCHMSVGFAEMGTNAGKGGRNVSRWVGQENEKREEELKMEHARCFRGEDPWILNSDFDGNG